MKVLEASGHEVVPHDLLAEPWTAETLRSFFGGLPPADWLNRSAVRVKSGEIDPDALSAEAAMALLLDDHALIRRPLMAALGERHAGWEPELIERWIGLGGTMKPGKEACLAESAKRRGHGDQAEPAGTCSASAAE